MIDRESQDARNGAFIIEITATEILKTGEEGPSITTEVTVIVEVSYPYKQGLFLMCSAGELLPSPTVCTI